MLTRREFIYLMAMLGSAPVFANSHVRYSFSSKSHPENYYKLQPFGNARILHMTDTHAQLVPVYFREPSVNIGIGEDWGKPPHLVGHHFLKYYGIKNRRLAYAYTCVDFLENAKSFGKLGGFAHIKTVADFLRKDFGPDKTLFLDGGDTWQGSWTALQTRGKDMVDALNILGVDAMTGHWEFTYTEKEVLDNIKRFKGDFVAQNVFVKDEALFNGAPVYDEDTGRAFPPYTIKERGGVRIAVIGQAFPYTTIANPQRFIPDWTFGIKPDEMQELVNEIKKKHKADVIVVLSHNGADVDKKMARVVEGIDFILGGHTHDAVPAPIPVKNKSGVTYVINSGSNGKFLSVLDLEVKDGKVKDFKYTLLPIFSDLVPADKEMAAFIEGVRLPYQKELNEVLATTDEVLYRRGNFNGSWDQVICDALREVNGAQISLSPGFRWGTTVIPEGGKITFDDLATQTAMTYPETYVKEIDGKTLKAILEDVADNLFNKDPFYQQGGDMVRTGGMTYTIDPTKDAGKRISDMRLSDGTPIDPHKKYKVSGWATVGSKSPGRPVWEVTAEYLRAKKHLKHIKLETPRIVGVDGNPGIDTNCS